MDEQEARRVLAAGDHAEYVLERAEAAAAGAAEKVAKLEGQLKAAKADRKAADDAARQAKADLKDRRNTARDVPADTTAPAGADTTVAADTAEGSGEG